MNTTENKDHNDNKDKVASEFSTFSEYLNSLDFNKLKDNGPVETVKAVEEYPGDFYPGTIPIEDFLLWMEQIKKEGDTHISFIRGEKGEVDIEVIRPLTKEKGMGQFKKIRYAYAAPRPIEDIYDNPKNNTNE